MTDFPADCPDVAGGYYANERICNVRNSKLFKEVNQPEVVRVRIGKMLDELKRFRGVGATEFSKSVGISRSLVYMMRRGENNLTIETATKIEKAYPEYTAAWLLGLDERPASKVDALKVLDPMVSDLSPERMDALLDRVQDFIKLELLNESGQ